ncbi:MAG: PAS domain S-box protein [Thermodesulfobacteriota bacterium]|nr:PAS domain S-box protein [Thermodesulfobacteriota bacterium]
MYQWIFQGQEWPERPELTTREAKQSETFFENVFNALHNFLIVMDPDGTIITANDRALSFAGIKLEDVRGKRLYESCWCSSAEKTKLAVKDDIENLSSKGTTRREMEFQVAGNSPCWIEFSISPISDKRGEAAYIVFEGHPVSDRERVQQKLKESEEKFRLLFENSPDAIAQLDRDGTLISVNPVMATGFGTTVERLLGRRLNDVTSGKVFSERFKTIQKVLNEGEKYVFVDEREGRAYHNIVTPFKIPGQEDTVQVISRDVTDGILMQKALQEEKAFNESLLKSLPDMLLVIDKKREITYASDGFAEIAGVALEDLMGKSLQQVVKDLRILSPEMTEIVTERMKRRLRTGETTEGAELELLTSSGERVPCIYSASPIRHPDGDIIGAVAIIKDIAEQKRSEAKLRESELKYRSLTEGINDGYVVAQDDKIVFANVRSSEICGYELKDMMGKPLKLFLPLSVQDKWTGRYMAGWAGNVLSSQYEIELLKKDGECVPVELSVGTIQYEGRPAAAVLIRDITKRRQAETELLESEKRYRGIFETAEGGIGIISNDSILLDVNPNMSRMFGYSHNELIGRRAEYLFHPDCQDDLDRLISQIESGRKESFESLGVRKDGQSFSFEVRGTRLVYRNQPAFLGILTDITAHKQAEEKLRESREELRNLAIHIQSVREEERTAIAREIHDDLGQALTAIKMDISWLAKRTPKHQQPIIEKTQAVTRLIDRTIRTVQRLARKLRPGLLDDLGLTAAIEWQAEEFQIRTGIECDLSLDPEEIILDEEHSTAIFRIFQETLTNVVRHAHATRLWVSLKEGRGTLEMVVRDNGRGITDEQIYSSQSFGLIGIRERVYPWGGDVKFKGVPGKGTTVVVNLLTNERGKRQL